MKAAVFGVLFAGWLTAVTHGQADTSCVEQLFSDVMDCFAQQGLDLSVQSGQQDATKLMRETQAMDPAVQCQKIDLYKKALSCSLDVLRQCLDNVNMGGSIPDSRNFERGMEVVCEKQDDFDGDCFKAHYPHIMSCGEETVKEVVQEKSETLTMNEIICLSADVNYDCSALHLRSCKNGTLDIYLELLDKYQVPSACVNTPPGRPRKSYVGPDTSSATTVVSGGLAAVVFLVLHLLHLH